MVITALSSWLFSRPGEALCAAFFHGGGRAMNLQTFLDAIPSFIWSDGNGAASGLAITAELFLLSIVPGMALAIAMAVGQVYGPRALALPIRGFTYFSAARRSICN